MTSSKEEHPVEPPAPGQREDDDLEEDGAGRKAKLALVFFPFLILLIPLLLDWWLRGRS